MSLHQFGDDDYDPHAGRRTAFQWIVYGLCGAILATVTAGMVWAVARGPETVSPPPAIQALTPPPSSSPSSSARRSETVAPEATVKSFPVDPSCWETRPDAERTGCQKTVAGKTRFVPRYMTNQRSLAAKHPAVKVANTGRGANSLARHGLLVCWLIKTPRYSLDDIRSAFYLWFHQHPFTVPNDDTDAAADNVIAISVQEICPSEAVALERKGGPKAELAVP